jgi:hypothetical protein
LFVQTKAERCKTVSDPEPNGAALGRELSDANLPAQEKAEYKESETKRQVLDGRYMSIARVAVEEGGGELGWSQELWALDRSGMSDCRFAATGAINL